MSVELIKLQLNWVRGVLCFEEIVALKNVKR